MSDEPDLVHISGLQNYDPHMHRLQRQDAKSRKTFKIKRHRSTIKNSMTRSATVKGGGTKYHAALLEGSMDQSMSESDPMEPEMDDSPRMMRQTGGNASINRLTNAKALDLEMQPIISENAMLNERQATEVTEVNSNALQKVKHHEFLLHNPWYLVKHYR